MRQTEMDFGETMYAGLMWDDIPIIGIDLETTGFSKKDKIVEIGIVMLDGETEIGHYHSLVNPERDIPSDSTQVHGIDNLEVRDAPRFEDILGEVVTWLSRGAPWIAHNMAFDMRMLRQQMEQRNWPSDTPTLCTQTMAKKRGHDKRKLLDLAAYYDIPQRDAHTALDDARVCARLARRMTKGLSLEEHVTKMSQDWWK